MFLILLHLFLIYVPKAISIKCEGDSTCKSQTIVCPATEDCFVRCDGSEACRDAIIQCPIGYACDIICGNADIDSSSESHEEESEESESDEETYIHTNHTLACYHMVINATQSSTLRLIGNIGNIDPLYLHEPLRTLDEVTIHCPYNGGNKSCNIICNGDDLMGQSTIYAVTGFNDLSITSTTYHTNWCIRATTVHCADDFSHSCLMTNVAPFKCQEYTNQITDKTCETYTSNHTHPTIFPTQQTHPTSSKISNTPTPTFTTISATINPKLRPTTSSLSETTNWVNVARSNAQSNQHKIITGSSVIIVITFICICVLFFIVYKKTKANGRAYATVFDEEHSDGYGDHTSQSLIYQMQMNNESETEFSQSISADKEEKEHSYCSEQHTISIPQRIFAKDHDKGLHRKSKRKLLKTYSFEEVSKHCTEKSCWIIVNNLVLDVTKMLKYHPGDKNSITKYGGTVCDEHFAFHSDNGKQLFWRFVVGKVDSKNDVNCAIQ